MPVNSCVSAASAERLRRGTERRTIDLQEQVKAGQYPISRSRVETRSRRRRMISQAEYQCPCASEPESSSAPTSSAGHYHLLASLYFCEECDALRCPDCVTSEVNIYFCPLCQFEVPSASVRAEQHTCARNCFLCPSCGHTCSSSSDEVFSRAASSAAAEGQQQQQQPKYWLTCLSCKWSSKQVGITFDKPTGLACKSVT